LPLSGTGTASLKTLTTLSQGEYVVFDQRTHNEIAVGRAFWVDAKRGITRILAFHSSA
jgi:hypothetical protein